MRCFSKNSGTWGTRYKTFQRGTTFLCLIGFFINKFFKKNSWGPPHTSPPSIYKTLLGSQAWIDFSFLIISTHFFSILNCTKAEAVGNTLFLTEPCNKKKWKQILFFGKKSGLNKHLRFLKTKFSRGKK